MNVERDGTGRMCVWMHRRGGDAQYGHLFGIGRVRVYVHGSPTFDAARDALPLVSLPWRLLDASSRLGEVRELHTDCERCFRERCCTGTCKAMMKATERMIAVFEDDDGQ